MRMRFADGAIDVNLDASLRLLAVSGVRRIGEGSKKGKESKKGKKRLSNRRYSTGSVSDLSLEQQAL